MSCLVKVVVVNVRWVVSCLVLQVVLPWFTIVSAVSLGSSPQLVGIPTTSLSRSTVGDLIIQTQTNLPKILGSCRLTGRQEIID